MTAALLVGASIASGERSANISFADMTEQAGIEFVLKDSATPEKHQIETMVGGVAVFDFDNDGKPDIYFVNGAKQPELEKTDASYCNRLYRNKGDWTFEDVTDEAGVCGAGYAMGVAAADFDNDGRADLFIAGVNRNILYRNIGDGTFRDVTEEAGLTGVDPVRGKPWSIAAGWFDYDKDGDLDLFVVNYVRWDPKSEQFCGDARKRYRTYCHPKYYQGLPNILYRNNGDGTFTDVSRSSGIAGHTGKGMGIAFADYDLDGDMDIFVANDTVPNFLFRNEGDGTFKQVALQAGVGFNDDGRALSSMGVDFRDVDNDGLPDLFITALSNETYPLFRNLGEGLFADTTYPSRLGTLTLTLSGWGNGIFDFNNDGLKDLFAANGDVQDNTELYSSRKSKLHCSVFVNQAGGTFSAVSFGEPEMHRGAAFGDFDGDGLVDAVVTRIGERPLLLRNTSPAGNHWLRLRLEGTRSNRDGIGARVKVVAGREQWNHATTSVGYASSSATEVHFGLGDATEARVVEIHWLGGAVQRLENVKADRVMTVKESGNASALP